MKAEHGSRALVDESRTSPRGPRHQAGDFAGLSAAGSRGFASN